MAVRDRLEDRLGPVVLASMNSLAEEVLVRELVGRLVVLGREAALLASKVETDDRQTIVLNRPHGGTGEFERGKPIDRGRRR